MKILLTSLIIVITSLLVFGQSVPNNKFNNWESFGAYENPEDWDTPNAELSVFGLSTVSKSIDAYSGQYSARLETKNIILVDAPGLITLADFTIDVSNIDSVDFSFKGGLPLQENVSSFSGMYKYSGVGNDSANMIIYNFKRNNQGIIDTIGLGIKSFGDADEWTPFTVEMGYRNSNIPDTFNVIIVSSGLELKAGSVLLVDNLTIETNTGILNLDRKKEEVKIYPNPAIEQVFLEMRTISGNRVVDVYEFSGKHILTKDFSENKVEISARDLPSGVYNFRITENKNIVSYGSFIVK